MKIPLCLLIPGGILAAIGAAVLVVAYREGFIDILIWLFRHRNKRKVMSCDTKK
jgi:hypothetical protein